MWWFVGLLIGMVLGGLTGSGSGVWVGGILGLIGGLIYGELLRGRNSPLEQRVDVLEKKVQQLSAQIVELRSVQPMVAQAQAISATASQVRPPLEMPEATASTVAAAPATQFEAESASSLDIPAFSRPLLPTDSSARLRQGSDNAVADGTSAGNEWLAKLFRGNILAKIGVVILFFGIASGLKLAVDMGLFPISVRLLLGGMAAISMSLFGYQRAQQPEHRMFGLAMQGGGMGILYLLVYFMLARYQIIEATLAFILFTLIGVSCVLLAARQDGRSLARHAGYIGRVPVASDGSRFRR